MKNIVLVFLFLSTILISCNKEGVDNKSNAIKVTAQKSSDDILKTIFLNSTVKWISGFDQVGLYSNRAYTTGPGVYASNVAYTAQNTSTLSPFTGETTVYFDGTTNVHNFYAYYPYAAGSPAATAIPISLPSNQAQVGTSTNHIGSLDFEVAKPAALTPVPGGVNPDLNLVFNHLFTILKFDLTCSVPNNLTFLNVTTSALPALSLNTGSTIDITQPEPAAGVPYAVTAAAGGSPLSVSLYANLPVSTTVASAYVLILPGDASANTLTISLTSSTGKTYQFTKTGINFERGKVYTVTKAIPVGGAGEW